MYPPDSPVATPSMSEYCCRIERAQNGYTVEMRDPEIVKANNAKNSKGWRSPEREYVFESLDAVLEFLKANLERALPLDEFSTAFSKAIEVSDE